MSANMVDAGHLWDKLPPDKQNPLPFLAARRATDHVNHQQVRHRDHHRRRPGRLYDRHPRLLISHAKSWDVNTDRATLAALYTTTNGSSWLDDTNWVSNRPLGEWHGVRTDADGRVTELNLDSNQLSGPIPSELGDLYNLQGLWLGDNQLSGPIPPELGNLANLEELWLSNNQLSGSIPPELGNLANLEELWLSNNQLSGSIPPELGNLANLQGLWLGDNQFSGCVLAELLDVPSNDVAYLGLPFC